VDIGDGVRPAGPVTPVFIGVGLTRRELLDADGARCRRGPGRPRDRPGWVIADHLVRLPVRADHAEERTSAPRDPVLRRSQERQRLFGIVLGDPVHERTIREVPVEETQGTGHQ
jgi:hypothetical protein